MGPNRNLRSSQRRLHSSPDDRLAARQILSQKLRQRPTFQILLSYFDAGLTPCQWPRFCHHVSELLPEMEVETIQALEILVEQVPDSQRIMNKCWLLRLINADVLESIPSFLFRRLKIDAAWLPTFVNNLENLKLALNLTGLDLNIVQDQSNENGRTQKSLIIEAFTQLLSLAPSLTEFRFNISSNNAAPVTSSALVRELLKSVPNHAQVLHIDSPDPVLLQQVFKRSWLKLKDLSLNLLLFDHAATMAISESIYENVEKLTIKTVPYNNPRVFAEICKYRWGKVEELGFALDSTRIDPSQIARCLRSFPSLRKLDNLTLRSTDELTQLLEYTKLEKLSSLSLVQVQRVNWQALAKSSLAKQIQFLQLEGSFNPCSTATWNHFQKLESLHLRSNSRQRNPVLSLKELSQSVVGQNLTQLSASSGVFVFDLVKAADSNFENLKSCSLHHEDIGIENLQSLSQCRFAPKLRQFSYHESSEQQSTNAKPITIPFWQELESLSVIAPMNRRSFNIDLFIRLFQLRQPKKLRELRIGGLSLDSEQLFEFLRLQVTQQLSVLELKSPQYRESPNAILETLKGEEIQFKYLERLFIEGLQLRSQLSSGEVASLLPNFKYQWQRKFARIGRHGQRELPDILEDQ